MVLADMINLSRFDNDDITTAATPQQPFTAAAGSGSRNNTLEMMRAADAVAGADTSGAHDAASADNKL
jgi:hypothetical protein